MEKHREQQGVSKQPHVLRRTAGEDIQPFGKSLRIVYFAKRKRHTRVTAHFIRGFQENGHQVLWIHPSRGKSILGERLATRFLTARLSRHKPDLIFIYQKDVPKGILSKIPRAIPRAVFYGDFRDQPDPGVVEVAKKCDFFFTAVRAQVLMFAKVGVKNGIYLRPGCDPTDHFPVSPVSKYSGDVAFIGKPHSEDRLSLMESISQRFQLKLYGKGWQGEFAGRVVIRDVYPKQYRAICASTKIMLGIDARDDVDLCFSNRTWITLGCGGFLLTRYVPGLEEIFENHKHLVWYCSQEECLELIEHYLEKEIQRCRIATEGCCYVHKYHTYRHATAEIVSRVFGQNGAEERA